MKRIVIALAAAGTLTASAAAFDNSTCSTFLVGAWKADLTAGGAESGAPGLTVTFVFAADGKATMTMSGGGESDSQNATWKAAPGTTADQCLLTAVQEGSTESPNDTTAVTVKDENTIAIPNFGDLKRQP